MPIEESPSKTTSLYDPDTETLTAKPVWQPKSQAFWMSFAVIMVATFLSVLDLTAVGTALPTIADTLNDSKGDYTWVGSAYALSSTAFIPLSGSLADAFGRRPIMLICIAFFAAGSTLAGVSQNMVPNQSIGGADLVPLAERGIYQGMLGLVWSFASVRSPVLFGGALSNRGHKAWWWLFWTLISPSDLNLPLTAIAFGLVFTYLSVRQPEGSVRHKLAQVDWIGNTIIIVGSGLAIIGMTWGGIRYSWASVEVLAPLIIGLFLLDVFAIYEAKFAKHPTIPLDVIGNRTSVSGYVHFLYHPIRSAVDFLPGALLTAPFAFLAGVIITIAKKYQEINVIGWIFTIIGFGLFSTMRQDAAVRNWVGFQIVAAIGTGLIYTILNMLEKKLPADFVAQFPAGFKIAYAVIPAIKLLEELFRTQVQAALADSMAVIWQVMIGISGLGFLLSFLMKEVPMDTTVDDSYALKEKEYAPDAEKA
ncbi:iron permease [Mycena crocata]|nr:iron permease [Mycena crocata]